MQLLAKLKKFLYMGFRAILTFRKFKVALNPMYRIQSTPLERPSSNVTFLTVSLFLL